MKNCEQEVKHISTCIECGKYISHASNMRSLKHKENVSKISCIHADLCFDRVTGVKKITTPQKYMVTASPSPKLASQLHVFLGR